MELHEEKPSSFWIRTLVGTVCRRQLRRWVLGAVLASYVAPLCSVGVLADGGQLRSKIRTAYSEGRLGDAVDATRDLVNELVWQFVSELQAALPRPPEGWSMSRIADPSLDLDAIVAGVFSVGARYARLDGRWIEVRLVGAQYDPADTMRTQFRDATPADQLSLSGFEGRWFSAAGAAASQSLVVLLHPAGGGPRVEARSSVGVTRNALLEIVTLESLERMMVKATIRGDLMVQLTNNSRDVEARMAELDGWYLRGKESLFSMPLGRARAMLAGFVALRGERLANQIGGIPAGWVPDADSIVAVSPTRPVSSYSRWYRRNGERFLVSVILGDSDGGDVHALRSAGIHWEEWTRSPRTIGRRRASADSSKIEIDVAFPGSSSRLVVLGDGRSAVVAAEQVVSSTDISGLWAWIRRH